LIRYIKNKEIKSNNSVNLFLFIPLGHGGSRTAEYLKNNLFKNLSSHPDFIKDTKTAIGMNFIVVKL